MKILNYGSLNIDYVYNVDHILIGGETQSATGRNIYPGGKGLNQSVAFARAGADIWHAGAIGRTDGIILLRALKDNAIHLDYLRELTDCPSGHTFIQVDKQGQNCILVYGGANRQQTRQDIDLTFDSFSAGDILVLQNEVNEISYMMDRAHAKGMKIVLNPSPMDDAIFRLPLDYVDFFMVNELEAAQLVLRRADIDKKLDIEDTKLLSDLMKAYPKAHIVLTVGSRGAYYGHAGQVEHHEIFDVEVVDTTAAGDTFTGYFIHEFAETGDAYHSLRLASAASTIAVSRPGATSSIPTRAEVDRFLAKRS